MKKYKNLLILLVVFGSIHLIFTGALASSLIKLLIDQMFQRELFTNQFPYILVLFKYAGVIIWIPVSIWIYKDSRKSMFAPWLWAILILIAPYQGLIIYLLIKVISEKEQGERITPNKSIETDAE
jgi:hypothetical protein